MTSGTTSAWPRVDIVPTTPAVLVVVVVVASVSVATRLVISSSTSTTFASADVIAITVAAASVGTLTHSIDGTGAALLIVILMVRHIMLLSCVSIVHLVAHCVNLLFVGCVLALAKVVEIVPGLLSSLICLADNGSDLLLRVLNHIGSCAIWLVHLLCRAILLPLVTSVSLHHLLLHGLLLLVHILPLPLLRLIVLVVSCVVWPVRWLLLLYLITVVVVLRLLLTIVIVFSSVVHVLLLLRVVVLLLLLLLWHLLLLLGVESTIVVLLLLASSARFGHAITEIVVVVRVPSCIGLLLLLIHHITVGIWRSYRQVDLLLHLHADHLVAVCHGRWLNMLFEVLRLDFLLDSDRCCLDRSR